MSRGLALALFLAAVSCSGSEEAPEAVMVERSQDELAVEADASMPLQYLPFCLDERKAVGRWTDSWSEARSDGGGHLEKYPDHHWTVLWRQRP